MTIDSVNYTIAEYCGWKNLHYGEHYDIQNILYGEPPESWWDTQESHIKFMNRGKSCTRVPNFDKDLNEMHWAEKCLSKVRPSVTSENPHPRSPIELYRDNVCVVTIMEGGPITASAKHRAKAFLKTIGKHYEIT